MSTDRADFLSSGAGAASRGDPMISLQGLRKTYPNGTPAVTGLDLEVASGELMCLVGPSGCGKTTTLKMINRLIEPTAGRIIIDGRDVTAVKPVELRRRIGYVIQQVGLFPHESVWENVASVPRLLGWDRRRCRAKAAELLELVGLDPSVYADRYPGELSGGQRQRVGVARALAADPPVLLMDEPFSAIDPIARHNLQQEFLRVQREVRKTIVMVTHDIDEAVLLADRIALFKQGGVIEQLATPARLLGQPANDFVARFVGADRGLRRLGVTPIEIADVTPQPAVGIGDPAAAAGAALEARGAHWAVVLDADARPCGWVTRAGLAGASVVEDVLVPVDAAVPSDATLKAAMGEALQHDAGWVAIVEPGSRRYLGVLTPSSMHRALRRSVDREESFTVPPSVDDIDATVAP